MGNDRYSGSRSRSRSRSKSGSRSRSGSRERSRSRSLDRHGNPRRSPPRGPPRYNNGGRDGGARDNDGRSAMNRTHSRNEKPSKIVGVFGMSFRTDEKEIKYRFGKYGEIENVVLVWNNRLNRSRGYAFVTYRDLSAAEEAVEKMNGKEIDGREVRVDYSFTKQGHNNNDRRDNRGGDRDRGYGRRRSRSRSRSPDRRRRRSRSRSTDRSRSRRDRSRSYDRRR